MKTKCAETLLLSLFLACAPVGCAHAELIAECADKEYLSGQASHIVEGTVKSVENLENHYYNEITIDRYEKGTPVPGDKITLVTAGAPDMWVEDEPVFNAGERVRLYLVRTKTGFSVVCRAAGVEVLEDKMPEKTSADTPVNFYVAALVLAAAGIIVLFFLTCKKNTKAKH